MIGVDQIMVVKIKSEDFIVMFLLDKNIFLRKTLYEKKENILANSIRQIPILATRWRQTAEP